MVFTYREVSLVEVVIRLLVSLLRSFGLFAEDDHLLKEEYMALVSSGEE
jgi:hypothetical protein